MLAYPVPPAPRTAVLQPWFRSSGAVRLCGANDWEEFQPGAIAATWPNRSFDADENSRADSRADCSGTAWRRAFECSAAGATVDRVPRAGLSADRELGEACCWQPSAKRMTACTSNPHKWWRLERLQTGPHADAAARRRVSSRWNNRLPSQCGRPLPRVRAFRAAIMRTVPSAGPVAKLADARDLGSRARKGVPVRPRTGPPSHHPIALPILARFWLHNLEQ